MDLNWIMARVEIDDDGCWIWQKALTPKGYGRTDRKTNKWGEQLVHRITYRLLIGDITDETLDHKCFKPACCNPRCLTPRSHSDNAKGTRHIAAQLDRTHCPRNHPYDAENTYWWRGHRHCRTCRRERQ